MNLQKTLLLFFTLASYSVSGQIVQRNDYLFLIQDTVHDEYGYINIKGDTIIKLGKYSICYTDTLKTNAIVLLPKHGFVAIDRNERILYEIFPFDNGPDKISEGLYRIIANNKIGFADQNGKIIIPPQFDCAYPFENGRAKVSTNCRTIKEGEHSRWTSDNWYFIDKKGKQLK
jgi:hypothetical protein